MSSIFSGHKAVIALSSVLLTSAMCALPGCDDANTGGPIVSNDPNVVASLSLPQLALDTLTSRGDVRVIVAIARNARGDIVPNPALVWTSSAPNVAAVAAPVDAAIIEAVDDGETTITATSGAVSATTTVHVHRKIASIDLAQTDSVLSVGSSVALNAVARDARQHTIQNVETTYQSDDSFTALVSPNGLVTALFTAVGNHQANITASVTRDGIRRVAARHFTVLSVVPPAFDFFTYMVPASVIPEPVDELGEAIVYFTREGNAIRYRMYWSYLTGAPTSAHIHVSPDADASAPILVTLPLGSAPDKHGLVSGTFTAADIKSVNGRPPIALDSLLSVMGEFATYADIHTARHPLGEAGFLIFSHRQ